MPNRIYLRPTDDVPSARHVAVIVRWDHTGSPLIESVVCAYAGQHDCGHA